VTFARLRGPDWVAMVAAVGLLFVMAMDWYGTRLGDEARRVEPLAQPRGALGGEAEREVRQDAALSAQGQERNAWQEDRGIDRAILAALLATVALAVGSAFLRAAGRRFEPPLTPSLLTAIAAAATALLVLYRILQEPGFDEVTTVKVGAPIAVAVLGVVGLAAATCVEREQHGNEFREVRPA
jgi:drug/metabolite transporter (DMT)-like permease